MRKSINQELAKSGIEKQISLPFSQSLRMCKNSIFVRLGRSVITASGIFLGIAFLSAVLTSSAILRGVQGEGFDEALQARAVWLVTMSLMVAAVGIANAMLMAVTERYKEIGTMKCLGALDSFVVRLFLLESGLLGLLGALLGALAGFLVMLLVYTIRFGAGVVSQAGPALSLAGNEISLWIALLAAVILGGILSVLATVYPAWRAAKMPPAWALRTEI